MHRKDNYLCAEIAVFVLNLSDIIFLRTAPIHVALWFLVSDWLATPVVRFMTLI